MKVVLIILISFVWCITVNAQLVYRETFENARYLNTSAPFTPLPNAMPHGIENCNPISNNGGDTAHGTIYDWTLNRETTFAYRGTKCGKWEIRKDQPRVGSSQKVRSEVTIIKWPDESTMARNMWYSFAVLFPSVGFEYDATREAINQWYEDGSSETTIRCSGDHAYLESFASATGSGLVQYDLFATALEGSRSISSMQLIPKNKWHEFVFHIFHSTGTDGIIEIWRDGVLIHNITGRRTIHSQLPKWKIGLYKASFLDGSSPRYSRIIYYDNILVGDSTATLSDMTATRQTNLPPISVAGSSQIITLPTGSVTVNGSGSYDPDGSIISYGWSKVSGGAATITTPTAASTTITGLVQGTYTFRLTVTDNFGAIATSQMNVTVNAAAVPPTANAGADQSIALPTSSVSLTGSGTGSITGYAWSKVSGFGGTITTPSSQNTTVTGLTYGTYSFRLTVTDGSTGLTGSDIMIVTVDSTVTPYPVAAAGADQSITLPTSTATLDGSGSSTPSGTLTAYLWEKVSGPTGGTITTPTTVTTGITALQEGTYAYRLTVTNSYGKSASDLMQIIVNPATPPVNLPPTVNAGADQSIQLPTSSTSVTAIGNDPDGTIVAYSWTKLSGPVGGFITSATSATTTITGLQAGTYTYSVTVTDNNSATGSDVIQITVLAADNVPPAVSAGADKAFELPKNAITITGTATDSDGTIESILWAKTTGPTNYTISNATTLSPTISGLVVGTYTFVILVTDNNFATATDSMTITVASNPVRNQTHFNYPKVINKN